MNRIVVLATHGAPPTDYPPKRVGMLMALEFGGKWVERLTPLRSKREFLEHEVRTWPRMNGNDPYKLGAESVAAKICEQTGLSVIVGYNEFCEPSIAAAIEQAIKQGATKVIVATTMITPGGGHSENDIVRIVQDAQRQHPDIELKYAWPYDLEQVAQLYANQIQRFA